MFVAGGYASTGGLVPITRGGSLSLLQGLADPNRDGIHAESVNELVRAATRDRDARLVLVITGKGRGGEIGVLRRQVPQWLGLPEFRALVVGFEDASVNHGGEGALYIRVRRSRPA